MRTSGYQRAKAMLAEAGLRPLPLRGASKETIADAERRHGVTFPPSYRRMLEDHGIFMCKSIEISGLGLDGVDGLNAGNVVWATEADRKLEAISPKMVTIGFTGYGPFFALDCAEPVKDGEAPVYEVHVGGYKVGRDLISPSFGHFLENEVALLTGGDVKVPYGDERKWASSYWQNRAANFD